MDSSPILRLCKRTWIALTGDLGIQPTPSDTNPHMMPSELVVQICPWEMQNLGVLGKGRVKPSGDDEARKHQRLLPEASLRRQSGWWLLLTPLKNDGLRQLGWWSSQLKGKIRLMFQTTNQSWNDDQPRVLESQKKIHGSKPSSSSWYPQIIKTSTILVPTYGDPPHRGCRLFNQTPPLPSWWHDDKNWLVVQ